MAQTTRTAVDDRCERLVAYLRERAADGEFYFKSKFIADELDLSSKEIGALIPQVKREASGLRVEKWAYTNATTWRVVRTDAARADPSE